MNLDIHTSLPAKDTYHVPVQHLLGRMHAPLYELPPETAPMQHTTNKHIIVLCKYKILKVCKWLRTIPLHARS